MNIQLSLFEEPRKRRERKYLRDRVGRFATPERAEMERLKRDAEYYRFRYEAECRKNRPILDLLIKKERELKLIKDKLNENRADDNKGG